MQRSIMYIFNADTILIYDAFRAIFQMSMTILLISTQIWLYAQSTTVPTFLDGTDITY